MGEQFANRRRTEILDAHVYTDGASRGNPGPAAAACHVFDPSGGLLRAEAVFLGKRTNNEAEYAAVLMGMDTALRLGKRRVKLYCDSNLIVSQIRGDWKTKEQRLRQLLEQVRDKAERFASFEIGYIPREHPRISAVDSLVNMELDRVEKGCIRG